MQTEQKYDIFNTKTVFVDFDDTLYIHGHHFTGKQACMEYNRILSEKKYPFDRKLWNSVLCELLHELKEQYGARIIILTVQETDDAAAAKYEFADTMEPGLFETIARTCTVLEKEDYICQYMRQNGIWRPAEIGIIDDNMTFLGNMEKKGCVALTPQYIMLCAM